MKLHYLPSCFAGQFWVYSLLPQTKIVGSIVNPFCVIFYCMSLMLLCLRHCSSCLPASQCNQPSLTSYNKIHSHRPPRVSSNLDGLFPLELRTNSVEPRRHYSSFVSIRLIKRVFRSQNQGCGHSVNGSF